MIVRVAQKIIVENKNSSYRQKMSRISFARFQRWPPREASRVERRIRIHDTCCYTDHARRRKNRSNFSLPNLPLFKNNASRQRLFFVYLQYENGDELRCETFHIWINNLHLCYSVEAQLKKNFYLNVEKNNRESQH